MWIQGLELGLTRGFDIERIVIARLELKRRPFVGAALVETVAGLHVLLEMRDETNNERASDAEVQDDRVAEARHVNVVPGSTRVEHEIDPEETMEHAGDRGHECVMRDAPFHRSHLFREKDLREESERVDPQTEHPHGLPDTAFSIFRSTPLPDRITEPESGDHSNTINHLHREGLFRLRGAEFVELLQQNVNRGHED